MCECECDSKKPQDGFGFSCDGVAGAYRLSINPERKREPSAWGICIQDYPFSHWEPIFFRFGEWIHWQLKDFQGE